MPLTPEQKQRLDDLLRDGILTQAEYDSKISAPEPFQPAKLTHGMLNVSSATLWAKDLSSIFNVRKLIIFAVIAGAIFGYAYWKGLQHKPIHIDSLNGKEAMITIIPNQEYMHITKEGTVHLEDQNGKTLRQITVGDIPALEADLKPIGFQLKPIFIAGVSASGGAGDDRFGAEVGGGVSWFKFYKLNVDSFVTSLGAYPLGVSYTLDKLGEGNTAVGIAPGRGWENGDTRLIGYFRWKF